MRTPFQSWFRDSAAVGSAVVCVPVVERSLIHLAIGRPPPDLS